MAAPATPPGFSACRGGSDGGGGWACPTANVPPVVAHSTNTQAPRANMEWTPVDEAEVTLSDRLDVDVSRDRPPNGLARPARRYDAHIDIIECFPASRSGPATALPEGRSRAEPHPI